MLAKQQKRIRRHSRIRKKIKGVPQLPRLCVFRSSRHIYAQLIDDSSGVVLASASDLEAKTKAKSSKIDRAKKVGELIAAKAKDKEIENVVFDRGGYRYHGRVRALAQGARESGLKF